MTWLLLLGYSDQIYHQISWVRGWSGEALVFAVITYHVYIVSVYILYYRLVNLLTLDIISSTAFGLESDVQRRTQGDFAQNAFLMTNSSEANATLKEKLRLGFVVLMTRMYAMYLIIVTLWPIHICNFNVTKQPELIRSEAMEL